LTKPGLARFIAQLEPYDEVAVEVTANIYYFYNRVRPPRGLWAILYPEVGASPEVDLNPDITLTLSKRH
jgi:hypothetical protein